MAENLTRSDIEDIMALVERSSFEHLTLEMGDLKISLTRRGAVAGLAGDQAAPSPAAAPAKPAPVPPAVPPVASGGAGLTDVCSEMLGTYYHAPKPGADKFITVGATVTPDTVIGIIEVMKLMTSVVAGVNGTVAEIVAPDGEMVEHGQILIRVRQDQA